METRPFPHLALVLFTPSPPFPVLFLVELEAEKPLIKTGLIQTRHDVLVPFAQRLQGWD